MIEMQAAGQMIGSYYAWSIRRQVGQGGYVLAAFPFAVI